LVKQLVESTNSKQEKIYEPIVKEYNRYQMEIANLQKKFDKNLEACIDEVISKPV
jgi:hypothetical protein